ncbi:MAG: hypothetical protein CVU11_03425 [Bacteroidetes bacterium HGW-Bacteroidetes-6]|jgi:hypothetical protein|nr:MAG: hypothetical protein CVU11_03425 [Bacteroidetes bacterium HGW-Bacteroidetes-6]
MKYSLILLSALIVFLSACGPSDETKKAANDVFKETHRNVNNVIATDSSYALCMQYLLREIQAPDLKKARKKVREITDSIGRLDIYIESLISEINTASATIDSMNRNTEKFTLLAAADTLIDKYNMVAANIYTKIANQLRHVSLPVKDAEYTIVLQLTYQADSILNSSVERFNNESAAFFEEYSLKDFSEK